MLDAAGYAKYVVDAVHEYIKGASAPELEANSQSQGEEMAPKRARTEGSFTKSVKKVPVAPSVKKYVKKCMDRVLEDKYKTTDASYTNIPIAGATFADTLLITQGITDSTRIGNNIRVKSFTLKGFFSDSVANVVRIILAWDRQCNGATAAVTDILATGAVNSQYNSDYVVGQGGNRFDIITDKRYVIQPTVATQSDYQLYQYTWNGNKVVHYDGTAGTVADVVSNNLVFLYIADSATTDFAGNIKIKYVDA